LRRQASHPILYAMNPDDLSARIGALEDEIDELADVVARSRRAVLLSRCVGFAGGAWLLASAVGVVHGETTGLVFAIAMAIGGMVFAGSSLGTIRQTEARIARCEALREELIDAVSPSEVAPFPALDATPRMSASPEP
jgi:hypothetical protein